MYGTENKGLVSANIMISCVVSLMSVCMILTIIVCMMSTRIANEAAMRMENALSASCLAGLNVDLGYYEKTYIEGNAQILISDVMRSYELFKETLSVNIGDLKNTAKNIIVKNYIIYNYNADDNVTKIFYFNNNGLINSRDVSGDVFAPNGIKITRTSVFADVDFDLNLFVNRNIKCHKQLLTSAEKR